MLGECAFAATDPDFGVIDLKTMTCIVDKRQKIKLKKIEK